jgi:hypothetical protein
MEFTYTINHYDAVEGTVNVTYSNADPELDDITTTMFVTNVKTDEQLTAIIIESAPIKLWAMSTIEKDLNPIIGNPQTAHRELLREQFNPTIKAVRL